MTLDPLQSLVIFVLLFMGGMFCGWLITIASMGPLEFCCKAGKHWFSMDRPCPVCIAEMVEEYKAATDTKSDGDE